MDTTVENSKKNTIFSLIKGIFISIFVSLIGILIFAIILKFFDVPKNFIQPINQVIKFLSILLGVKSMYSSSVNKNLLFSVFLGAIYTLLAMLIFSLLNSNFDFNLSLLTDCIFGAIAGLISGIVVKILMK